MNRKRGLKSISIEWHSIVQDVIRNIWAIIMAMLIAFMGLYVAEHSVYSPEYKSTAIVVVNAKKGNYISYLSVSTATEMATIFSDVFVQPSMKAKAAANLGMEKFDGTISANVMSETNFVEITVISSSPETAYKLLDSVLEVYPSISDNIFDNAVINIVKYPSMSRFPNNTISLGITGVVIFAAAALTFLLIVIISVLRDTVKTENGFKKNIDAPLLGTIPHEYKGKRSLFNKNKSALLINGKGLRSLRFTESYQKIVTKIENMNAKDGDKVFTIVSVAENEGKSTAASNIAMMLANRGNKVLLLDLDEKKPALYKIFDFADDESREDAELGKLLEGDIKLEDFKFRKFKKTSLLMALNIYPHGNNQKWFENGRVQEAIDFFKQSVDYIIIDTAPISVDASVTNIVPISDQTILVVRNDVVRVSSINDAILTIKNVGGKLAGCIFNDVYSEFSLFGQSGYDEGGYYSKSYSGYGKYGKYGKYGRYGKYRNYGYNNYNKYNRYNNYKAYQDDSEITPDEIVFEQISELQSENGES